MDLDTAKKIVREHYKTEYEDGRFTFIGSNTACLMAGAPIYLNIIETAERILKHGPKM